MKTIEQRAGEYAHKTEKENGFDMHPKTASFQGYYTGFSECKKEYEENLRWIPVEEKQPELNTRVILKNSRNNVECRTLKHHHFRDGKLEVFFSGAYATHYHAIDFL